MTEYETKLRDDIYKDALSQALAQVMTHEKIVEAAGHAITFALQFANKAMEARNAK